MMSDQTERPAGSFSLETLLFERDARRVTASLADGMKVDVFTRSNAPHLDNQYCKIPISLGKLAPVSNIR